MIGMRRQQQDSGDGGGIPHRVHLVGAGGVHMSAIGQILRHRGHEVTGSDLTASEFTERLEALGARIHIGPHQAASIEDAQLVVRTAAVKLDNVEVAAATERGIPVMLRAEMVAKLMADRDVLAIAGTHGKTTTTALVALMTVRGDLDPMVLLGGDSRDLGNTNVRDGAGRLAIVEADEYAEAFLEYEPRVALITNVEADHLDYYGTEERMREAFAKFAARVKPGGTLLVCADSPAALTIGEQRRRQNGIRVERYALDSENAEWRATRARGNERGGLDATIILEGQELGRLSLGVPGRHNLQNALGALAVAMRAGVDFHRAAAAASQFTGADRRFDFVGEVQRDGGPITLVDDYAHHPTEVRATLLAARQRFPNRRLVACFQPHTYSRSTYLLEAFRTCFESLDALYVLRTYEARETSERGMDARALAAEIQRPAPAYLDSFEEAADRIAGDLRPGDAFFTLGAGDVTNLGPMILERLEAQR